MGLLSVPPDGNDERRSSKFACLWRRDGEGVVTNEKDRPDKSGVVMFEHYSTVDNNDGLQVHITDARSARAATKWLAPLVDTYSQVAHIGIAMPGVPMNLIRKKTNAISRSGIIDFFKHKRKDRGGI